MVHIIHTTRDDADVTIDGDLIHESSVTFNLTHFDERTLTLQAFALVGGGFAAVTNFQSSNMNIQRVVEMESVGTAEDVEVAFATFEPTEHISERTLKGSFRCASENHRLRKQLFTGQNQCIEDVVKSVNDYIGIHPSCEYIKSVEVPRAPNRILKFFGLE